jgi:hypothetical protein
MLQLLGDLANQSAELQRALSFHFLSEPGQGTDISEQSFEGFRRKSEEYRLAAEEVLQQMQSLLLRLFSLTGSEIPPTATYEIARDAAQTLENLLSRRGSGLATDCRPSEADQAEQSLEDAFSRLRCTEALEILKRLRSEHASAISLLARMPSTDSILFVQVRQEVGEIYRTALGLLRDGLEIMHSSRGWGSPRTETVGTEIPGQQNQTMSSDSELAGLTQRQWARMEALLDLCRRCETSLRRTCLELADMKTADAESTVRRAAETLQRAIQQAKEVQVELQDKMVE